MATKKTVTLAEAGKLKSELAKTKKAFDALKKKQASDLLKLAEEAYYAGYIDAMVDMDEKAEAMDKFIEKSLLQFEKEYAKKVKAPVKKAVKKKKTKKTTKKRT